MKTEITQAYLREVLNYCPDSGALTWRTKVGRKTVVGQPAGTVDCTTGYIRVGLAEGKHQAHRLVWMYMTGEWPTHCIDHKNLDRSDNRWDNMRPATKAQNMYNTPVPSHNTSGIKGVGWSKSKGKWRATISINNKAKHIGYFSDSAAAETALQAYRQSLHGEFACHG
jgi:hypothetical protein